MDLKSAKMLVNLNDSPATENNVELNRQMEKIKTAVQPAMVS